MSEEQRCPDCFGGRYIYKGRAAGWCRLCGGTGLLPERRTCPNINDPVLCVYDPTLGYVVAEAGCAVHDPDERARAATAEERRP